MIHKMATLETLKLVVSCDKGKKIEYTGHSEVFAYAPWFKRQVSIYALYRIKYSMPQTFFFSAAHTVDHWYEKIIKVPVAFFKVILSL